MIDWTTVFIAIISLTLGAGGVSLLSYLFFPKQVRKKEDYDVIKEDASAAKEMLEFAKSMSDFKDEVITNLQLTVTQQNKIIASKDTAYAALRSETEDNKRKIHILSLTQSEHERKIKGISGTLRQEVGKKQYAEQHICIDKSCRERKPALGTFKTDNPKISE